MAISITYDLLNAQIRQRWGVLYIVIGHKGDLPPNLKQLLAEQLPEFDTSAALVHKTIPAAESPIEALDSAWVKFIKWPIKLKEGVVTEALERDVQQRVRANVNRSLIERGFEILQFDFEPVGMPLTGDHGLPATPTAPPADVKIWPAAVIGLLSLPLAKLLGK